MLVLHFGKKRVCSFPVGFFVCVGHNQSGYLTLRTTEVKGAKLILAVISFQVG